jgi:hypothetical protein
MSEEQVIRLKKYLAATAIVNTLFFALIALVTHFTIVADPNAGWPLGELIHKTAGIWWVVLATAAFGSQMAFISWMVFQTKRKAK